VNVAPYDGRFFGGSPTQLAVAPDGKRLYATLSAANAVAVLAIDGTMPKYLGAFPTGWYPTALAFAPGGLALDVVDGMGEGATANPQFKPFTSHRGNDQSGYVATNRIGSVRRIALPTDAELAATTSTVHGNEGPSSLIHRRPSGASCARAARSNTSSTSSRKTGRTIRSSAISPVPTAIRRSHSSTRA